MEVKMEARVILTLETNFNDIKPILKHVDAGLKAYKPLDNDAYFGADGSYNADGSKAMTNCFIQGLAAIIAGSHRLGYVNEADNMRFIISELERAYVAIKISSSGTYGEKR